VFGDAWTEPDGRVRRLEYHLLPGKAVPLHHHPGSVRTFEVVAGVLHVRRAATTPGTVGQWFLGTRVAPLGRLFGYGRWYAAPAGIR
jgi:hypothetical protein